MTACGWLAWLLFDTRDLDPVKKFSCFCEMHPKSKDKTFLKNQDEVKKG